MSSKAIVEAWNHSQAGGSELLLLLAIADNADPEDGMAWPKESLLASKARVTERQVRRLLEALEQRGELEIWTYVRTGEAALRNAYRITVGEFSSLRGKDPTSLFKRGSGTKAKRRIPPALRRTIMERDSYSCVYCGSTERPSIDHRLPESRGGDDSPENLQVLCVPCNVSKRTMTDEEWREKHGAIPDVGVRNGHTVDVLFTPDVGVRSHAGDPVGKKQEHSRELLPLGSEIVRNRDVVWDFVVSLMGEPLPRHRKGHGRIASDLRALLARSLNGNAGDDQAVVSELTRRHSALAGEWGDAKATPRALVQHWEPAGKMADGLMRPPKQTRAPGMADRLMAHSLQLRQLEEQ